YTAPHDKIRPNFQNQTSFYTVNSQTTNPSLTTHLPASTVTDGQTARPVGERTHRVHGADVPQEDFDHHLHHAGAKRSAEALARAHQSPHRRVHPRRDRHGAQALRARPAGPNVARGGRHQKVVVKGRPPNGFSTRRRRRSHPSEQDQEFLHHRPHRS